MRAESCLLKSDPINLEDLAAPDFWQTVSDQDLATVPLDIVLPSGRALAATSGHLALTSDALYTYEVMSEIDRLCRGDAPMGIKVRGMLDIDYYEAYRQGSLNYEANLLDSLESGHFAGTDWVHAFQRYAFRLFNHILIPNGQRSFVCCHQQVQTLLGLVPVVAFD